MHSDIPEEKILGRRITQKPEDPEDTENPYQTEEPHMECDTEDRTHKKRHRRQDRDEIYHTVNID